MNFLEWIGVLTLIVLGTVLTIALIAGMVVYAKIRQLKMQMRRVQTQFQRQANRSPNDVVDAEVVDTNQRADTRDNTREQVREPVRALPQSDGPPLNLTMARVELRGLMPEVDMDAVAFIRTTDLSVDLFDSVCDLVPEEEHDALADAIHGMSRGDTPYHAFVLWNEQRGQEKQLRRVQVLNQTPCEAWSGR